VPVRRQGQQPVDGVAHPGAGPVQDVAEQLERLLHLRVEVLVGERELGGRERGGRDRRDVVGVDQDRAVRVRPDLQVGAALALVHQRVHVPDDRERDLRAGALELRDGAHVDHLVHRGGQRDGGAGHAGEARAPHPAGEHHELGVDVPAVGPHATHPAALGVDAQDLGVRRDGQRRHVRRLLAHERPGPQRVDHGDRRGPEPREDQRGIEERHPVAHLVRADQLGPDAPGPRGRYPSGELLDPLGPARHLDAAAGGEGAELLVLAHRVRRQRGDLLGVVHREDEVGRVAGGAARVGQRPLVQQDEVPPAQLGEVVDDGVADDPGPDDDDLGPVGEVVHGFLRLCGGCGGPDGSDPALLMPRPGGAPRPATARWGRSG